MPAAPRPPGPSLLPRPRRRVYAGGGMHEGMPPPPPPFAHAWARHPPPPPPFARKGGRNEGTPPRLSAPPPSPSPSLFAPPRMRREREGTPPFPVRADERRNEGTPTAPPLHAAPFPFPFPLRATPYAQGTRGHAPPSPFARMSGATRAHPPPRLSAPPPSPSPSLLAPPRSCGKGARDPGPSLPSWPRHPVRGGTRGHATPGSPLPHSRGWGAQ
ncbi:hypothetical protein EDB83DRAFT_2527980 [Lactarius deliciosus]|nr:hypothetical protein EDB83DRAFT_2527980 [Lactarius deliciosus]